MEVLVGIHEIKVLPKGEFDDPRGHHLKMLAQRQGLEIGTVLTTDDYYLEGDLSPENLQKAQELLHDPVSQEAMINPDRVPSEHVIEVAPLPGVMDPAAENIVRATQAIGIDVKNAQTSTTYTFLNTPKSTITALRDHLVNSTVEQARTEKPTTLEVVGGEPRVDLIDIRQCNDDQLLAISKERSLALNVEEMKAIQAEAQKIDRPLTDVELEYMGAAWSEHCCHKTFAAELKTPDGKQKPPLFQRIKDRSRPYFEEQGVLSAFHDNSGVWSFAYGKALCIKLETHNSPMNLEPKGGAETGTGGVLRDIVATGTGAEVINSQHMQFLAPLNFTKKDIPAKCHTPAYLIERSVTGVRDYGNRMGVPTNDVSFHTHPNFRGKGSILVGSMGIMPEENAQKGQPKPGDLVIAAGGKTGRDGLHGATFSSETADSGTSTLHSGAVQIGNAIEEKKVFDAIKEASDEGLIIAMTDCGAAGFASAVGEMGEDIGVSIDLANAPLKYNGLSPWEIFLSESQERMVLAINPDNWQRIEAIFEKHESSATVLGTFGSEGEPSLHVEYGGQTVVDLRYEFIKNGLPSQTLAIEYRPTPTSELVLDFIIDDPLATLRRVLANGNVCSTEPIVRQYDHEVKGMNALNPYGGASGHGRNEAVVMTPVLGKDDAVVEAHGTNPTLSELDPRAGTIWSFTEAVSNFVAAGGNPDKMVLVNNYISATPTPGVLGKLDQSVDALMDCVDQFHSPVISGKDSLSSSFKLDDGSILESPYNIIITVAGNIPDVHKTVSSDLKKNDSYLMLVGKQDLQGMGGAVALEGRPVSEKLRVPQIDLPAFQKTARGLHRAIQDGIISAAQDIAEGGLLATVAQMAIGGNKGVELLIDEQDFNKKLYNETAGCFVVEVDNPDRAREIFSKAGVDHHLIGRTRTENDLIVHQIKKSTHSDGIPGPVFRVPVNELQKAWIQPFEEIFS